MANESSFTNDCDNGYEIGEQCEVIDYQLYCMHQTVIGIECTIGIEDVTVQSSLDEDDICHETICDEGLEFDWDNA